MEFPQQFPFLIIPTGAGPGQQRIEINVNQSGAIDVYNSSGQLVNEIGGLDGAITAQDVDGSSISMFAGSGATLQFMPQTVANNPWIAGSINTSIGGGNHPAIAISAPGASGVGASLASITLEGGSKTVPGTTLIFYAATTHSFTGNVNATADLAVTGNVSANNIQHGNASASLVASSTVDVTVTFPNTFSATPDVVGLLQGTPAGSSNLMLRVVSKSTTQVVFRMNDAGAVARTLTMTINWFAISN